MVWFVCVFLFAVVCLCLCLKCVAAVCGVFCDDVYCVMCRFAFVESLNVFVWFACDSLCDVVWSVWFCLRVVVCVVAVAY